MRSVFAVLLILSTWAQAESVELHRDQWGVPHIYADTDAGAVYGYLYAQAQDNFWQIEDSYIQALGRYAEVVGEQGLASDYLNRALQLSTLARKEYEAMNLAHQRLLQAGARALNDAVTDEGIEARLIAKFEPWHILAHAKFYQYQLFVFGRARISNDEIVAFLGSNMTGAGQSLSQVNFELGSLALASRNAVADAHQHAGSNTWAIHGSRTKSGETYLFINPHQPYFGPGQWYEGHVVSKEGLQFSGASFPGTPFPTIGHNGVLGWSHTVNEPDIVDVYTLDVSSKEEELSYRFGDQYRPITQWRETILVKTEDGLEERQFQFMSSHHGPILAERDGKLLAVRMAQYVEGGQLVQRLAMVKSRSLDEFKSALGMLATPMFNTMYADAEGNIYYAYYGAVPRRDEQFDWSKPVDGSDPRTEWQGYHPLDELPTITNPETGYLQNCNATPFLATGDGANLSAADYPSYMVSEGDNNRSRMSRVLLGGDEKFSWRRFKEMTWDTRVIEADVELPRLEQEFAARDVTSSDLNRALKKLLSWDRVATVSSTETTLYFFYRNTMLRGGISDPVEAFKHAVSYMQETYGSTDVAWGDVNRLQRAHTSGLRGFDDDAESLPVAGGPGNPFGTIFNFYARPQAGKQKMYGVAGHSFVSVARFGEKTHAESIMVFGANSNPESPHYFDQSRLFAEKTYKSAWFNTEDVVKNAQSSQTLEFSRQ